MQRPESKINPRVNHRGHAHAPQVRSLSQYSVIESEDGVLRNVLLCQAMQPKGAAGYVDLYNGLLEEYKTVPVVTGQDFINQLLGLSLNFREKGLKVRFGHPAMCEQEAGMHCGWVRNIRIDGDGIVGDIYLADFADLSPKGNLKSYVLKAATEDPEALMMSIVFSPGGYYFMVDGEKREYSDIYTLEMDTDFWDLPEEEQVVYETAKAWHYTDFVSEGANTNNLFRSANGEPMSAALVTNFLDENPQIFEILTKSPEIVSGFLKKYEAHLERAKKLNSSSSLKMSKPKSWLQRSAEWLSGKLTAGTAISARNIEATTADGVAITILTDSDVPSAGDQVQVTETGEAPPAGVHTIAGGDLDGYTITTDETGTITEVMAPTPAAPAAAPVAAGQEITDEQIRAAAVSAVADAVKGIRAEITGLTDRLKAIEEAPVANTVRGAGRQVSGKQRNATHPFQAEVEKHLGQGQFE
jgi:hypothetical protein